MAESSLTNSAPFQISKRRVIQTRHTGTHSKSADRPTAAEEFNLDACLFCDRVLPSQQIARRHMQDEHGLHIPLEKYLIVDWETLLKYLHLIIFEYHECIYCHTERHSSRAVQEHMIAKNHCQYDIDEEGSEFRDFYDFDDESSEADDGDIDTESQEESDPQMFDGREDGVPAGATEVDKTLRLPSGKIISNRKGSAGNVKSSRQNPQRKIQSTSSLQKSADASEETAVPQPQEDSTAEASTASGATDIQDLAVKPDKSKSRFKIQQANLRESDRLALARLPLPEQRAILATAQKQEDQAERAQKSFGGKMDNLGNIKVSERFVNDVPGGKAHRNRFFAR